MRDERVGGNVKQKLLIAALLGAFAATAFAQVGGFDSIVAIANGTYAQTSVLSVTTSANATLVSASGKRPDLTCRNHSSDYTIFIGTNAATTTLTGVGFPVYPRESFEVGGFSDAVYAIASGGTADVRCWEGKIR